MSSSTPPSMPSSASTEMPLAWARSTTRLEISTFLSNGSWEASIIDRAEETGVDALVAGLLVTVVEVDGEDGLGEDLAGRADDGFEHALVGVGAGTLGNLDDERGLRLDGAA